MKNKISITAIILLSFTLAFASAQKKHNKRSKSPVPEQITAQDLFIGGHDNVFEYRIPSLITSNKGTLLAVCDARVDKRGDAPNNIDLVMKKSHDGGKTWSAVKVIRDYPGNEAAADPSLIVDKETGTIWLAYDYAVPDPQGDHGRILRIQLMKSDDDGETWSSPVDLSYLEKGKDFWLQNGPGRGLYSDGVIIFPMYTVYRGGKVQKTVLVYSNDNGKTWALSNEVGEYNVEPQAANISGNRIMVNMRKPYGYGYRQIAVTGDMGDTWQDLRTDSTLIESGCHASFINYNFDNKSLLLFSNPADSKERKNMVVKISNDEGKGWQKEIHIYSGSAAYSCMTQLPNGNVGLLYEADKYNKLVFVEIPSVMLIR